MKIFLSYSLSLKRILTLLFVFGVSQINAQVKFRIEPGLLLKTESENIGVLCNLEPHIAISKNNVIGLRFGVALNAQKFETNTDPQFFFDQENDNAVISFVSTFDHYLNEQYHRPYLGMGIGYYVLSTVDVFANPGSQNVQEGTIKNQLGLLLRGGLESGSTRLGLEYNFIPKANIEIINDQVVGKVNNSYFGISVGFQLGSKKKSI